MTKGVYRAALTPRRWQSEALGRWRESGYRGVVSVVTGGGKTVFAQLCINECRRRWPGCRVIIVVPTLVLADQWHVALQEDLNVPHDDIRCFSGQERGGEGKPINIVVINTGRTVVSDLAQYPETFLIVDECHRAGSAENARAIRGNHVAALGMSATPAREYDDGFATHVTPALGNIVYEYDYRMGLRDGVISPFRLVNVQIPLMRDEARRYQRLTRAAARAYHAMEKGRESSDRLRVLLQRRADVAAVATMRIPVAARIADEHKGCRSLIFHERISAADELNRILKERGYTVGVYHSRLSPGTRRDNLRLFRRGAFDVLVACRSLDEGLNVPNTEVAVVASGTGSRRQRVQRLGRVLRPSSGKERAVIYTLFTTEVERDRLMAEAVHLDGVASVEWRRVEEPPAWKDALEEGDRRVNWDRLGTAASGKQGTV